jgi:hypothetical protein
VIDAVRALAGTADEAGPDHLPAASGSAASASASASASEGAARS